MESSVDGRGKHPNSLANLRGGPGVSGNPSGRPRNKILTDAYKEKLSELAPNDPKGRTFAEIIAERMVMEAVMGRNSTHAANELANRTEGTPIQTVRMIGEDPLADLLSEFKQARGVKVETTENAIPEPPLPPVDET